MRFIICQVLLIGILAFLSTNLSAQYELPQDQPIHAAARSGNVMELRRLIEHGADANVLNASGESPLHCAVHHGRKYAMEFLLQCGANPNLADPQDIAPLHWAVYWRRPALVKPLLEHGAKPDARDKNGSTPLHWLQMGNKSAIEILKLLLDHGADPNAKDQYGYSRVSTILQVIPNSLPLLAKKGVEITLDLAIDVGDATMVRKLLAKSPRLAKQEDDLGNSPLLDAILYNRLECIDILVKSGAPVNKQSTSGHTPLTYAATQGSATAVRLLLSLGALPDQPNQWGDTPLDVAVYYGRSELINLLRSKGVQYTIHHAAGIGDTTSAKKILDQYPVLVNNTKKDGKTPLHYAAACGKEEMVEYLISRGAVIDATDSFGLTPLMQAVYNNWIDCAKVLLDHGADKSIPTKNGRKLQDIYHVQRSPVLMEILNPTPFEYPSICEAAYNGSATDVARHIARGEDVNRICEKSTPLTLSIVAYATQTTRLLLNYGADPKLPDGEGQTPIELAFRYGSLYSVLDLIRNGVDVNSRDDQGRTALHLAVQANNVAMVRDLLDRGADPNLHDEERGDTPLGSATFKRNQEIVELLLDYGADINLSNKSGGTVLMCAVSLNSSELVELFIERGADVNQQDKDGGTALHTAAGSIYGNLILIDTLVKSGASIHALQRKSETPLFCAARNMNHEIVGYLKGLGAEYSIFDAAVIGDTTGVRRILTENPRVVNQRDGQRSTPLHWAAYNSCVDVVTLLLAQGAVVDATDNKGWTPLLQCANSHMVHERYNYQPEQLDIARLLLDKGANPNHTSQDGLTPLFEVTDHYYRDFINLLLAHGARHTPFTAAGIGDVTLLREFIQKDPECVNRKGYAGYTPVFLAAANNQAEAVHFLADKGADLNVICDFGWTPLIHAIWEGKIDGIKALLDRGADVLCMTKSGTALNIVEYQRNEVIKKLVRSWSTNFPTIQEAAAGGEIRDLEIHLRHTTVDEVSTLGWTALGSAIANGKLQNAEFLLDHGASVETLNQDGKTPLDMAVEYGQWRIVEMLLKHGADVHWTHPERGTLLHIAAEQGDLSLTRYLLDAGIAVDVTRGCNETPLWAAITGSHLELAAMLLDHKANPNIVNCKGFPLLLQAISTENIKSVQLLLEKGADPNHRMKGIGPLFVLVSIFHSEDILRLLFQYGANPNLKINDTETVQEFADRTGSGELLRRCQKSILTPTP